MKLLSNFTSKTIYSVQFLYLKLSIHLRITINLYIKGIIINFINLVLIIFFLISSKNWYLCFLFFIISVYFLMINFMKSQFIWHFLSLNIKNHEKVDQYTYICVDMPLMIFFSKSLKLDKIWNIYIFFLILKGILFKKR